MIFDYTLLSLLFVEHLVFVVVFVGTSRAWAINSRSVDESSNSHFSAVEEVVDRIDWCIHQNISQIRRPDHQQIWPDTCCPLAGEFLHIADALELTWTAL